MNSIITKTCRECGQPFSITPEVQKMFLSRKLQLPERCLDCRAKRRQVEHIPCKDCGTPFPMNQLEIEYYEKKGWAQPKRCPECREKRRQYAEYRKGHNDPRV